MNAINEKIIADALKPIRDPATGTAVLQHIPKILVKDDVVHFSLEYGELQSREQLQQKEHLLKQCEIAVRSIPGVKDVKVALSAKLVMKNMAVPGVKKIILIASGKGGVGKSTVASYIAIQLEKMGKRVALVDADIYGPSIPRMCGTNVKAATQDGNLLPIIAHNIKLISMGFLIDEGQAAIWRGPMVTKALHQLIRLTNWQFDNEPVDYMIIDTPPGTGDVHLSLASNYAIDGAVIVSTPQVIATQDAQKAIEMFNKLHIPILGVVENMSFYNDSAGQRAYIFGQGGTERLATQNNLELLGQIPLDSDVVSNADVGMFSNNIAYEMHKITAALLEKCP